MFLVKKSVKSITKRLNLKLATQGVDSEKCMHR